MLIANRGEIAVRIIRACHELGVRTVAIHSTADSEALHVKLAHESICIGPPSPAESYLNESAIVAAAVATGADAIHPGYGFLSESASFAEICSQCGLNFVGPTVQNIRMMGNKSLARQVAEENNVPVIPGSGGAGTDADVALADARQLGFPVLIKASAGGGGRGMKVVPEEADFVRAFESAKREVLAAFGDPNVYVEKYIQKARHVEVQIVGDRFGNILHLGERDCSIQRRYQKLVEETPAPGIPIALKNKMHSAAVLLAKAIDYTSVGTVEFLYDSISGNFYFIEMNTRLQVEHPVTEMVTRVDIVKEQIWVAAGYEVSFKQEDIVPCGHAIEARINAEDPVKQSPCPGQVVGYHPPGGLGVRVDSGLYDRYTVTPYYDSLIAKIVVWGQTRSDAIRKLLVALDEYIIEGISTNMELHRAVLLNKDFQSGKVHTKLFDDILIEFKEGLSRNE
jgi:acetyl-CoA carboxylase biotin carboxylase subunit